MYYKNGLGFDSPLQKKKKVKMITILPLDLHLFYEN